MELDPKYVQTAVRRWEAYTGKEAVLEATGGSFEELFKERRNGRPGPDRPDQLFPTEGLGQLEARHG